MQHFRQETKTFISRLDPRLWSLSPTFNPTESSVCNSSDKKALLNFLSEIHKTACNVYARGYGRLRFDQMPKAECQKFIQTMMSKPDVTAAVKALNGQRPIWVQEVKKDIELKGLAEFCP
jgi:hypothetical protein